MEAIYVPTGIKLMNRGRPREFDEKEALQKAMLIFWRNGYRGTSLDDLTQALGISRPSLYAAFKDKETMFLRVVDHMIALLNSASLRPGLEQFFQTYAGIVAGKDTPPGCFVACLLSEECCESPLIQQKLAGLLDAGDRICTKAFERKKAELNPALSPEAAGSLLTSAIDGFALRARAGASKETILKLGDSFIELVVAS